MSRARLIPLLLLVASAIVVGGAWLSQLVGGLQPCELCLYQRWPYYAVIVVAVVAATAGNSGLTRAGIVICALAFLIGAGLAFYHVGVEQHWFAGPSACTSTIGGANSVEELRRRLLDQQPVLCDQVQWSLFGISLAGWNFFASLALLAFSVWVLFRSPRWSAA